MRFIFIKVWSKINPQPGVVVVQSPRKTRQYSHKPLLAIEYIIIGCSVTLDGFIPATVTKVSAEILPFDKQE